MNKPENSQQDLSISVCSLSNNSVNQSCNPLRTQLQEPQPKTSASSSSVLNMFNNMKLIMLKVACLALLTLLLYFIVNPFSMNPHNHSVQCIHDTFFEYTKDLNQAINDKRYRIPSNFCQIMSSLLMDISAFLMFYYWVKNGKTGSVWWLIFIFYGTREVIQLNFQFKADHYMRWDYPGIPSLVVPYGRTTDFYFSGHLGFLTFSGFEIGRLGGGSLKFIPWVCVSFMGIILISFRTHYSIDLPIGIFWGVQTALLVPMLEYRLDSVFRKLFCQKMCLRPMLRAQRNLEIKDELTKKKIAQEYMENCRDGRVNSSVSALEHSGSYANNDMQDRKESQKREASVERKGERI